MLMKHSSLSRFFPSNQYSVHVRGHSRRARIDHSNHILQYEIACQYLLSQHTHVLYEVECHLRTGKTSMNIFNPGTDMQTSGRYPSCRLHGASRLESGSFVSLDTYLRRDLPREGFWPRTSRGQGTQIHKTRLQETGIAAEVEVWSPLVRVHNCAWPIWVDVRWNIFSIMECPLNRPNPTWMTIGPRGMSQFGSRCKYAGHVSI